MLFNTYEPWKFAFSKSIDDLNEVQENSWGIIGVPFDSTSSYHAGSKFGPMTIREASFGFEKYNTIFNKNLDNDFYDFGDLNTIPGNCLKTCENLEDAVLELADYNLKPLIIGGEHSITYGAVKGVLNKHKDLTVIHLDAHRDLKNEYIGEKYSHGTVLRRVHELGIKELIQIGIRSSAREEEIYLNSHENIYNYFANTFKRNTNNVPNKIASIKGPIYLTIDLDVLDPAYAPMVSNPTPTGITPQDIELIFTELIGKNIVGFDIVEAASKELGNTTSITASKIIHDFLTLF